MTAANQTTSTDTPQLFLETEDPSSSSSFALALAVANNSASLSFLGPTARGLHVKTCQDNCACAVRLLYLIGAQNSANIPNFTWLLSGTAI